jgi:hypothetical protein
LYPDIGSSKEEVFIKLKRNEAVVDYIDTAEEETSLIAITADDINKNKYYTHMEIDPSLILGVMSNLIIYPENNPVTRNSFSCGQSKQAVSVYHSNYQMRIDKMGVVLNYGQIPLVKSRYLEYINKEEQPYGVNAIVAIMCYTGYNVEDAILINEGSILRGMFRTTYFSMYEAREESSKVTGMNNSKFANIEKNNVIGKKKGYDYSFLDDYGLIKENTELNDKMMLIGKINSNLENKEVWIDDSVKPKKGQLGYVDKSFITLGEEGFNVAKVRLREERIPAIGDKMASRGGQKGTLGLIIPEANMPFLEDGTRPDLIINPHAMPSRMTIGQIVESMFGIACTSYGGFGDCTAFQVKGSNYSTYGPMLTKAGFNHTGNHIMYDGMTGEQIQANIYMGPTYYMRLKHMVKDKINYRARGPNQQLTRQPVQGRANDGGLRIGEMERDGVCAHGLAYFLNESFLVRGDEYYMAVCNKTGAIAIYNEEKNLFMSPYADGPINFHANPDGTMNIKNLTKFGRSFSLLRIPYSFKLLIQELQAMNIQMRIITDENVDQLLSMSYSNNINKLLHNEQERSTENMDKLIKEFAKEMTVIQARSAIVRDEIPIPTEETESTLKPETVAGEFNIGSKIKIIRGLGVGEIGTVTNSQGDYYQIELSGERRVDVRKEDMELLSPDSTTSSYDYRMYESPPEQDSIPYAPVGPAYVPTSPEYAPDTDSPFIIPNTTPDQSEKQETDGQTEKVEKIPDILEVQEKSEKSEKSEESKEESKGQDNIKSDSGEKKVIEVENNTNSSGEIKKINI